MAETMAELLREGITFEFAWSVALKRHRPSLRDQRRVPPFREATTLFDAAEDDEPSVVEATRTYFWEAYSGEKPGLKRFSMDVLRTADDESGFASPHGRLDAAA